MRLELTITFNWRRGGPPPNGGGGMLYPGKYRVPQDVPREVADEAIADGAGELAELDDTPTRSRGKKPTGEDKALGRAAENKSALDG